MWVNCDALGIALCVVTWALLVFTDWVIVRYVLFSWFWTQRPRIGAVPLTDLGLVLSFLYQLVLGMSLISHVCAMTTDPGTVSESEAPASFSNPKACKLCQGRWKPPRAHHCKTCRRCIFRMDHHCPWVNNCVGLGNQKLFILFLIYTALAAAVTLLFLAGSAICWLWSQKSWSDAAPPGSVSLICSGLVAVECLAAMLFVGDFLQEQVESIQMNSTLVETYQRTHGPRSTFWVHWKQVFGNSWLVWPLPFPTAPAPDYTEPAISDEDAMNDYDDSGSLGIAGEETEEDAFSQMPAAKAAPPAAARADSVGAEARPRQRYEAARSESNMHD